MHTRLTLGWWAWCSGGVEGYAGIAFNMRTDSTAFLSALEEYGRKREELQQSLGTITAPPSVDKATLRFLNNVGVSQRDLRVRLPLPPQPLNRPDRAGITHHSGGG